MLIDIFSFFKKIDMFIYYIAKAVNDINSGIKKGLQMQPF
jgi:hypothetical protein